MSYTDIHILRWLDFSPLLQNTNDPTIPEQPFQKKESKILNASEFSEIGFPSDELNHGFRTSQFDYYHARGPGINTLNVLEGGLMKRAPPSMTCGDADSVAESDTFLDHGLIKWCDRPLETSHRMRPSNFVSMTG